MAALRIDDEDRGPTPDDAEAYTKAAEASHAEMLKPRADVENVKRHVGAMQDHVAGTKGGFYIVRWELLVRAAEDRRISGEAIKCLVMLADYVNSEGFVAWPKYETLSDRLGKTVDAVRKLIGHLEDAAYIVRTDAHKVGLRYSAKTGAHFMKGRGSTYALGLVGFDSFDDLIVARKVIEADAVNELEPDPQAGSERKLTT